MVRSRSVLSPKESLHLDWASNIRGCLPETRKWIQEFWGGKKKVLLAKNETKWIFLLKIPFIPYGFQLIKVLLCVKKQYLPFPPVSTDGLESLAKFLAHLGFAMAHLMHRVFNTLFLVFFLHYYQATENLIISFKWVAERKLSWIGYMIVTNSSFIPSMVKKEPWTVSRWL